MPVNAISPIKNNGDRFGFISSPLVRECGFA
jgi:hypothetical protein